jgi:transposase
MPVNVYFMAVETATHIAPLEAENQRLRSEVSQLKHELAQLKRLIFGAKSERFVPGSNEEQLTLFEEAPVETAPEPEIVQAHVRKRKPVRQALPDHLPRKVIVIEPAVDRSGLKKIGEEVWRYTIAK